MLLRRSVLRLMLAGLALPLFGGPGSAAGVGLSFDLTLVATRASIQPLVGASSAPRAPLDPVPPGLLQAAGIPDIGMTLGESVPATFRRESASDWALSLPRRAFRYGTSIAGPVDPATGLARFTLYDPARLILLDFPSGSASITESWDVVLPGEIDGRETLLRSVTYDFAIANVMGAMGMGGAASVAAFSSLGPHATSRGAAALSRGDMGPSAASTAGAPPSVVPLPAALLFTITALGAAAGLRRALRG